jgi:hypothetical protein
MSNACPTEPWQRRVECPISNVEVMAGKNIGFHFNSSLVFQLLHSTFNIRYSIFDISFSLPHFSFQISNSPKGLYFFISNFSFLIPHFPQNGFLTPLLRLSPLPKLLISPRILQTLRNRLITIDLFKPKLANMLILQQPPSVT